VRFIHRTLAICALAIGAGLTHSWFVPVTTSFGGPDLRGGRAAVTPPDPGAGEQAPDTGRAADPPDSGEGGAGEPPIEQPDPGAQATQQPVEQQPVDIDIGALGDFISVEEARAVWHAANVEFSAVAAFIDARFAEQYAEGHITTARRLMAHEVTDGTGRPVLDWLTDLQPDQIVIYCEGGECDASKNLARQLELLGFSREQLHVLEPGYPAWAETYPDLVTKGDQPGGA